MSQTLLLAKDIIKTFRNGEQETCVLKGIDLTLTQGKMIALQGASGSGKSTLLNILGLLMRPTSGELRLLDHALTGLSDGSLSSYRNRHLGFVFQYHNLLPDFTALENVAFPAAAPAGRLTGDIRKRALELLDKVGLSDRSHFLASQLSGGQKQRVAIARSLINNPKLVFADEPTGNLDQDSAKQVMALLRDINRNDNTTFLISTHDNSVAANCDEIVRIIDGKIAN
ncbi:peptide ABC transporter ATP-binding protein [Marinomonas ushuaiensis DSM 15871]|uniref:Peptide ABC transporter ATP-binding protein n=1 Tax=Marinomonas ushuaiensis DSM 15871 TaxID=1122207 RepID=X7E7H2_9GAMM|nr:ABC transporter ATP-binding protein [Marinomonas ushuaiensis]ETX11141.1 peptide ABC transporter ATP-binding protein [Marinomonas ushuaiensis DSM 15871]